MSTCRICEKRRSERYCPGVRGDICARCCGEEREQTIDCPLECQYLREARRYEKLPEVNPDDVPNLDIRVTEEFLHRNEHLLVRASKSLLDAALATPSVVDTDVREAMESMIRTQRTLESGLIYETRPNNPYAGAVQQQVQGDIQEFRRALAERTGVHSVRDKDVLGVLVFLQRLEYHHNNGRRRSRAFLDFLRTSVGGEQQGRAQSLILP